MSAQERMVRVEFQTVKDSDYREQGDCKCEIPQSPYTQTVSL